MKLLIGVIIGGLVGGGVVWGYGQDEQQMNDWHQQQQLRDLQFQQQRHMQQEFMRNERQHNPC